MHHSIKKHWVVSQEIAQLLPDIQTDISRNLWGNTSDVSRVFLGRPIHISNPRRHQHGWHQAEKCSIFVLPNTPKINSLAPYVLRFFCKTFSKFLQLSLRKTLFRAYLNNFMAIRLCELRSDLSLKGAVSSTERITGSSVNYLHKIKSEY